MTNPSHTPLEKRLIGFVVDAEDAGVSHSALIGRVTPQSRQEAQEALDALLYSGWLEARPGRTRGSRIYVCPRGKVTGMALNSDPVVDWKARADGAEHILVKGKHYNRDETLVRRAASMWALRNHKRALTEIGDDQITVRFVERTGKV